MRAFKCTIVKLVHVRCCTRVTSPTIAYPASYTLSLRCQDPTRINNDYAWPFKGRFHCNTTGLAPQSCDRSNCLGCLHGRLCAFTFASKIATIRYNATKWLLRGDNTYSTGRSVTKHPRPAEGARPWRRGRPPTAQVFTAGRGMTVVAFLPTEMHSCRRHSAHSCDSMWYTYTLTSASFSSTFCWISLVSATR